MLIFWSGVSCFSVTLFYSTLFCCGGKANLVWFTLFYSTLLTLTDRQKDRQRNKYTRFAWAGGTFFPVVLMTGKISSSRLSGGCAINITTKKKDTVVCLASARCIEFECNKFVLVLVQIDLIHFEHSICISST